MTPQFDDIAERAVLGSIFLQPAVLEEVLSRVAPDDLYLPAHRYVLAAMMTLRNRGSAIDAVTVADELGPALTAAGGESGLLDMARETPTAENVEHYVRIVIDHSVRRALIAFSIRVQMRAADETQDLHDLLADTQGEAMTVTTRGRAPGIERVGVGMDETLAEIRRRCEGETGNGYPVGIPELEDVLGNLQPGTLNLIGARPSVGKTSLALNILLLGAERGYSGMLFTLEMTKPEIRERMISARTGIPGYRIRMATRRRPIQRSEWSLIYQAAHEIEQLPLWIDDSSERIETIVTESRRFAAAAGPGPKLIAVDYVQLVRLGTLDPRRNRDREVGEVSRALKGLVAKGLGIPVLAMSQLNRDPAKSKERPRMHHLRESGSLEADADSITLLHRDTEDPNCTVAEAIVEKNRGGQTGIKHLSWHGPTMTFSRNAAMDDEMVARDQ